MATIKADKNGVGQQDVILKPGAKVTIEFELDRSEADGSAFGFQCPELAMNKACKASGDTLTVTLESHETLGLNLQNYFRIFGTLAGQTALVVSGRIYFE